MEHHEDAGTGSPCLTTLLRKRLRIHWSVARCRITVEGMCAWLALHLDFCAAHTLGIGLKRPIVFGAVVCGQSTGIAQRLVVLNGFQMWLTKENLACHQRTNNGLEVDGHDDVH